MSNSEAIVALQLQNQRLRQNVKALSESLAIVHGQATTLKRDKLELENNFKRHRIKTICILNEIGKVQLPDLKTMWTMSDTQLIEIENKVFNSYSTKNGK